MYFGKIIIVFFVFLLIYKLFINKVTIFGFYNIIKKQQVHVFLFLNFNNPIKEKIYFIKEPEKELLDEIAVFHDHVIFFLIIIIVTILCLIIVLVNKFFYKKNENKNLYIKNTLKSTISLWGIYLELFWTLIPCAILFIIVFPSFIILYSSTPILNKVSSGVSVKVIGRQWYWTYEYLDHLGNVNLFDNYILQESDLPKGYFRSLQTTNKLVVHDFGVKLDVCHDSLNEVNTIVDKFGVYFGQSSGIYRVNNGFMPIAIEVYDSEVLKSISNTQLEDDLLLFNETTKAESPNKEELNPSPKPTQMPEFFEELNVRKRDIEYEEEVQNELKKINLLYEEARVAAKTEKENGRALAFVLFMFELLILPWAGYGFSGRTGHGLAGKTGNGFSGKTARGFSGKNTSKK